MPVVTPEDIEEIDTQRPDPPWSYLKAVAASIADGESQGANLIQVFRQALADGDTQLKARFADDEPVEPLIRDRARLVDLILRGAWQLHAGHEFPEIALLAVGGYGRGELNLCSDIDVMILLPKSESTAWQGKLEGFLTFMWDIGMEVGHSVRTIDECQREAAGDITIATTLIEARLLAGPDHLFDAMRRALSYDKVWPTREFFEAKVAEQVARHAKYHDTAYNLEPNVKASPGGLRDIQTIGWVVAPQNA